MANRKTDLTALGESDYTKLAEQHAEEYARNYHGAPQSMSAEFNETRPPIQRQRTTIQQHNDLSGLSLEEAKEAQEQWAKDAADSALNYCLARNAGKSGKSLDVSDSIVREVETKLERNRRRGWYKKS